MSFPKDFQWGVSTASYQIEGAAYEAGKGESVWDLFSRKEGAVEQGETGDIACDHYHRWREDVGLIEELGVQVYRLSLSWPRIIPEGRGKTNPKGVAFYDKLFDTLLEKRITPWVALFHWDYPNELFKRGGWLNPDSPDWFAEYAAAVMDLYSDRVKHWITIEEPESFIDAGHREGRMAPGLKLSMEQVLEAGHHTLLAHGKSVQTIRARAKSDPHITFVPCGDIMFPASNKKEDIEAARQAYFTIDPRWTRNRAWWTDPVFLGHYPEDGLQAYGKAAPKVKDGDMEIIHQPLDSFALSLYHGTAYEAGPDGRPRIKPFYPGYPRSSQRDWPVVPEAMYWGTRFNWERYKKPIYIAENGNQNLDSISVDGKVHDPQRIDYLTRYLRKLGTAIDDGVDIRGYFYWTIIDNFEWALGYKIRVGLVYTDYPTQKRIPKDSFYWYQKIIETNGGCLKE